MTKISFYTSGRKQNQILPYNNWPWDCQIVNLEDSLVNEGKQCCTYFTSFLVLHTQVQRYRAVESKFYSLWFHKQIDWRLKIQYTADQSPKMRISNNPWANKHPSRTQSHYLHKTQHKARFLQASFEIGIASDVGNVTERNNSSEKTSPRKWESIVFAEACKSTKWLQLCSNKVLKSSASMLKKIPRFFQDKFQQGINKEK